MDTSYFILKCASVEHLKKCIESEIWAYRPRVNPPQPEKILEEAHERGKVILIFSVNNQHGWHGICESRYQVKEEAKEDVVPSKKNDESVDDWQRFPVKWLKHFQDISLYACLPLDSTKQLILVDGSPVNQARNWQQASKDSGKQLCDLICKHYEYLFEKKTLSDKEKQKPKEDSFFKSEEESITSSEDITKGWTNVIKKVERDLGRVILACPFGSQRYNCSLPESDNDIFIVYQAKSVDILGLDPPKQTIKNSESEKVDYTILEIHRYCELLTSGDPKCIETLFIYEDSILVVATKEWQQLRTFGKTLLTRTCLDKYLREAQGSRGIKQLEKWHNQKAESHSSKIAKLGYIILRLLQSAWEIVVEQNLVVYRPTKSAKQTELLHSRNGQFDYASLTKLIDGYLEDITKHQQNCQDLSGDAKSSIQNWLVECRIQDLYRDNILTCNCNAHSLDY